MARVDLPITDTSVSPYYFVVTGTVGTADNMEFTLTGNEVVLIENVGAASRDVIFRTDGKVDGETVTPRTVTVGIGETVITGKLNLNIFSQPTAAQKCYIDLPGGFESDIKVTVVRNKRAD